MIQHDVPFAEYRSWPAFHSGLLNACARSMLHAREFQLNGRPDTPALAFGRLAHFACLQPDVWRQQRCLTDECGRKSKKFEEFTESNPDRLCATVEEAAVIDAMCQAVHNHVGAWRLLSSAGGVEVSARWTDSRTGLACKARFDKVLDGAIADLKTTEHAGYFQFASSGVRYGYHRQAAFYVDGWSQLHPEQQNSPAFIIIAVEKSPPYAVAVYELLPDELLIVARQNRRLMERWAECSRTGVYPGYCETSKLLALPEYALHDDGAEPITFDEEEMP